MENRISDLVLQAAFNVHKALGPGLLGCAYLDCLTYEIRQLGLDVDCRKEMPLQYGDLRVNLGYAIDMMVERRVLIQVSQSESFSELDMAKMKTYLKLSGCKIGFLVNFNVRTLKEGIRRVMLNHEVQRDEVRAAI
ncbi:MAG: GxxExxY protein [Saprospiraceae bacterium]|nr:GxxExxY protein [Saprospiraceae bacterium]